MQLILNLGFIRGPVYIHIILEIIQADKKMFILGLDGGQEVQVPNRLRIIADNVPVLPSSMIFYDPLYIFVKCHANQAQKVTIANI